MIEAREEALPLIPRKRECSTKGCSRQARVGGYDCRHCNSAAFRRWYKKNRKTVLLNRRTATKDEAEEDRALHVARSKLSVYIKRGKIKRGFCSEASCASSDTVAYIRSPAEWRTPIWACLDHRPAIIQDIESRMRMLRLRDDQETRRERALAGFASLPADAQAKIRISASRGPFGLTLDPQAPLYMQNLVKEVERLFSE